MDLRKQERDAVGTSRWVWRHHEQLQESDNKRLEDRQRAERLFAESQLQYEQFKQELHHVDWSCEDDDKEKKGDNDHNVAAMTAPSGPSTWTPIHRTAMQPPWRDRNSLRRRRRQ